MLQEFQATNASEAEVLRLYHLLTENTGKPGETPESFYLKKPSDIKEKLLREFD